jgi:hypothetical protein
MLQWAHIAYLALLATVVGGCVWTAWTDTNR